MEHDRFAIGHELFHFLQEFYFPTTLTDPSRGLWMKEASAVWFETIFVAGSCPGVMSGDYQFAWRELFNAAGSAVEGDGRRKLQNHGYGAAAVLKYRTDQSSVQNDPFVRTIWDNMKNGSSELDAFQSAVGASVSDYWTRFAKEFFTGIALPGCVGHVTAAASATIKDASSLSHTFKFGAYPLSSIAYKFDLMKVAITDKTPLPITAKNLIVGQTVYVYDLKDKKELAQLTKSSNTYTIEDVVAAKGRILMVTFVDANMPAGSAASTNEVTITTGDKYTRFSWGFTEYTFLCAVPGTCGSACRFIHYSDAPQFGSPLTWKGNAFEFSQHGWVTRGELSADQKTLLSFSLRREGIEKERWINLPLDSSRTTADTLVFAASGMDAQDNIVLAFENYCLGATKGVDFTKKVQIEVWLAK